MQDGLLWLFIGLALAAAGYGLLILPTQWLKIERIHHAIGINKKIVQISDLHVEKLRVPVSRLQRILHQEKPDYIFITGDFTQRERYLLKLAPYLQMIRDIGVPVFAVLGNHDYQMKRPIRLIRLLEQYDIQVLRNSSVVLDGFVLLGIDDFCSRHSRIEQTYKTVKSSDLPLVVITHDPNIVLATTRKYHYLMSGHLHGKQVAVPFLFKLRPMGKLPESGIYQGLHFNDSGAYYISKGISQTGLNIRLFVRSEISVHHL